MMQSRHLRVAAALVVAAAIAATVPLVRAQQPATGTTAYVGARVIFGDERPPLENATIVVRGGRFVQVGPASGGAGASRCHASGPDRQDRHADSRRHPRAPQPGAVPAHSGSPSERVLGHRRGYEPWLGRHRSGPPGARGDASARGPAVDRWTRHHHAGARPPGLEAAVPDQVERGGAPGRAGTGGPPGRHRQDLGRRSERHGPEDAA